MFLEPKPKCDRCRWPFPGFHICVDLSTPEPKLNRANRFGPVTDAWRTTSSLSMTERWAQKREEERPRDDALVQRYKEGGIGIKGLGVEFGISSTTALAILKRYEIAGLVEMRKRGQNISKGY